MLKRIRRRLDVNTEHGFTVIEFLVVVIIIGILLAIAVPSYLGFRDRAANNAAKTNLRAALPSAEAYYSDNGTYKGMTVAKLQLIDQGLATNMAVAGTPSDTEYCLTDTEDGKVWSVKGPGGTFYNNATCASS